MLGQQRGQEPKQPLWKRVQVQLPELRLPGWEQQQARLQEQRQVPRRSERRPEQQLGLLPVQRGRL